MQVSLSSLVGMPRIGKDCDHSNQIWRCRKQESGDIVLSESLDDAALVSHRETSEMDKGAHVGKKVVTVPVAVKP